MNMIVIDRCTKMPGLIDRGRTYRLIYNERGLYIICLGRATNDVYVGGDLISNAIADKIINLIANKFEKEIQATETRLKTASLDEIAKERKNYYLPVEQIVQFNIEKNYNNTVKIKIKGQGVNINLLAHSYYTDHIESIKRLIKA